MSFTPTGPTEVRRVTAPAPPPAVVDSPFVGRLEFAGGFPTEATLQRVYDQLDFQRACQVFLRHLLGASMYAFREGLRRDLGATTAQDFVHFRLDARGLLLTGNSETVYGTTFLDLKADGPTVLEVPPRVLGFLNDLWMRPLGDLGLAGPDAGAGRAVPRRAPRLRGELPAAGDDGIVAVVRSRTYRVWCILRAFLGEGGDAAPAVATLRAVRVSPGRSATRRRRCASSTPRGCRSTRSTPIDGRYFEHLAAMVAYEHEDAVDPEVAAGLAQLGIDQGTPFAPDARLRGILEEAARVGSAMAFALCNAPRGAHRMYPDRQWFDHIPGYPGFRDAAAGPMVDAMVQMAWFATGRAQAMGHPRPGTGSAYTWTYRDAARGLARPGAHLPAAPPGPRPGQGLLVGGGLRPVDALHAGQRPALPERELLRPGAARQRRRRDRPLPRARAAGGVRGELDPHPARHRLVPPPAPLRADRALVRQDLEARRPRTYGLIRTRAVIHE